MSISPEVTKEALRWLRDRPNPFEHFVQPEYAGNFHAVHVPEIHEGERLLIWSMIDAYRVSQGFSSSPELCPTRVVLVEGNRGVGKTHLLRSLLYRADARPQLIIRPSDVPRGLTLRDYLLGKLWAALSDEPEGDGSRPGEILADTVARRLLVEAIRGMSPTDRVSACSTRRLWSAVLFGSGQNAKDRLTKLATHLDQPGSSMSGQTIRDVIGEHGLRADQCFRLICGHLSECEPGSSLSSKVRNRLYRGFARWAILREEEDLAGLIDGGAIAATNQLWDRSQVAAELLEGLIEVASLADLPVVFAYDNVEGLFSPGGVWEPELASSFIHNLAQLVDQTRGMLILIFIERFQLQTKFSPHVDEFAQPRLSRTIPSANRHFPSSILIREPVSEALFLFLERTLSKVVADYPNADSLPKWFPFEMTFIEPLQARLESREERPQLRTFVQQLHIEYGNRVHPHRDIPENPAIRWRKELKAAQFRLGEDSSLLGHRQDFHAAFGSVMEHLRPVEYEGWVLRRVEPTYRGLKDDAIHTTIEWHRPAEDSAGTGCHVAVSLLLQRSGWMFQDLAQAFQIFTRPKGRPERLLVLWPDRDGLSAELIEALPPKTREIWDAEPHRDNAMIVGVNREQLASLMAFPAWLAFVRDDSDVPLSSEQIRNFIRDRERFAWITDDLLPLLQPPDPD